MQKNNVYSLESYNAIPADKIEKKTETSINPIIVKKEPGTGSLFPICILKTLVLYTKIRKRELVPDSLLPINSFEISQTFT